MGSPTPAPSGTMAAVSAPLPTADELLELESEVGRALSTGDVGTLDVIGFGEISIALGWPAGEPRVVCKRSPPFTPAQFEHYQRLVTRYIAELTTIGVTAVTTTMVPVARRDRLIGYLIQPLLPASTLADRVLRETTPSADHPLLAELGRLVAGAGPRLSVDAQVSNWAWDGRSLTLLDVGTPFLWDEPGRLQLDMTPFLSMLPAPVRPLARRDLEAMAGRWRTGRGTALDVIAGLHRLELDEWIGPMLTALNEALDPDEPLTAAEGRALFDEDLATWPRLKRLQQVQRAWRTRIMRRPYEFFIQNSFSGEIV